MSYENAVVQEIYARDWKVGKVDPIGKPVSLSHFLEVVRETGTILHPEPWGRVEGGEWDGGVVIRVETQDLPLFFVISPDALAGIREYLTEDEYNELVQQSKG